MPPERLGYQTVTEQDRSPTDVTCTRAARWVLPAVAAILPFVLFLPYRWLIFDSPLSTRVVTDQVVGIDRLPHLAMFASCTFFPFAGLCLAASLVMLVSRSPQRWLVLLLPALWACAVAVLLIAV